MPQLNELAPALQQLGFTLDMQPNGSFYTMCKSFDFTKQGMFSLDIFVAMAVTLTNAKKVFDMFSRGGPQATFDFNQYIYSISLI